MSDPQASAPGEGVLLRHRAVGAGAAVFLVALLMRLLFWQATQDAEWPHSASFKGDALVWLEYAHALESQRPYELGLPIHPPGAAYLVASLWNGRASGVPYLKLAWVVLGALTAALLYLAALRSFGFEAACLAGLAAALSTGLMILSTSLNSETPYLLLVIGSFCLCKGLSERPSLRVLALWSALQAVACLFRPEHLLFYLSVLALLVGGWHLGERVQGRARLTLAGVSLVCFLLPLLPWHLTAWNAIRRFNQEPPLPTVQEPAALRRLEDSSRDLVWDAEAGKARDALPAFARRTAATFVAATVMHRGGGEMRAQDLGVLEEAFGYRPRPLFAFPFVSLYGPLNFALANHAGATGGFNTAPLEQPPPLVGGAGRFPPALVQGLPPPQLALVYPPHLRLFNEGYAVGWGWIHEHPAEAAALAVRKLQLFWAGAALGVGGFNLPLGLSGIRRAVDLVVPDGVWPGVWRLSILVACALGVAAGWRRPALYPWLLFLLSKVAAALLFFGYARLGATVTPVVGLLCALAADRWIPAWPGLRRRAALAGVVCVLLCIGTEAARWVARPELRLGGRSIAGGDPLPWDHHQDVRLEVRPR